MLEIGAPALGDPSIPNDCPGKARLTVEEARGSFGAWCAISSPLILSFDVANLTEYDTWWPVVSNTRAIAIHNVRKRRARGTAGRRFSRVIRRTAYAPHAGVVRQPGGPRRPVKHVVHCADVPRQRLRSRLQQVIQHLWRGSVGCCQDLTPRWTRYRTMPFWTAWAKPTGSGAVAAIVLNSADSPQDVTVPLAALGFPAGATVAAVDVWTGEQLPSVTGAWTVAGLPSHGSQFVEFRA